jgi:hypothetical protein
MLWFFLKKQTDTEKISVLLKMAKMRDARSPLNKKIHSFLTVNDKTMFVKSAAFVIIRNMLFVLSIYLYYIY